VRQLVLTILLAALLGAPAASAKSVYDLDIGWTDAQRARLHLPRVIPGTCHRDGPGHETGTQRLLGTRGDPTEALRAIFHYHWAGAWIDFCDKDRMGIGVPPSEAAGVPKARAVIARHHLTGHIRLFAARSSGHQISAALVAFNDRFRPLLDQGLIESGEIERGIVEIELAKPLDAQSRKDIRAYALAAPVAMVVRDTNAHDFTATAL
jgi:hypothetical protein